MGYIRAIYPVTKLPFCDSLFVNHGSSVWIASLSFCSSLEANVENLNISAQFFVTDKFCIKGTLALEFLCKVKFNKSSLKLIVRRHSGRELLRNSWGWLPRCGAWRRVVRWAAMPRALCSPGERWGPAGQRSRHQALTVTCWAG